MRNAEEIVTLFAWHAMQRVRGPAGIEARRLIAEPGVKAVAAMRTRPLQGAGSRTRRPRTPGQVWPVPLRYRMIRSGQVQVVPQGWPSSSRGVFCAESQDLSRT